MPKATYKLSPFDTFTEQVAGQLSDPWYWVEPGATPGTVVLATGSANAIGLVYERDLPPDVDLDNNAVAKAVTVIMRGMVAQPLCRASGAIPYGSSWKIVNGGTIQVAATGEDADGVYLGPDAANGDLIQVHVREHVAP